MAYNYHNILVGIAVTYQIPEFKGIKAQDHAPVMGRDRV